MLIFNLKDKSTWSDNVKRLVHYYDFNGLFENDFISDYVNGFIKLELTKTEVEQINYILESEGNDYVDFNNKQNGVITNTETIYKPYSEIIEEYHETLTKKYSI